MPVYMEISQLHRTVTIVARGQIEPDEIRGMAMKLAEARVRPFAKILEVAGAFTSFTAGQVKGLAVLLGGNSGEKRGPIAFVIDAGRGSFARTFADQTASEGPVRLFTSLRDARKWTEQVLDSSAYGRGPEAQPQRPAGQTAFTDPGRQGVLLRGSRQREVTVSLEKAA